MHDIATAVRIGGIQLRKNLFSQRTGMIFLLEGIYLFALVQPVREMAIDTGYSATPFALAFLACDAIVQMVLMAGAVALFANAPFEDETHPYLIVRSGRRAWIIGNSIYLIAMSVIYVLFLWIMSMIPLIPKIVFKLEWGKIWGTLAETDARRQYQILFEVSNAVKRMYQPGIALFYTLLLEWGCVAFLGACVYCGNSVSSKPLGVWIGAGIAFFDIMIYNLFPASWITYSPLSLAMISNLIHSRWGISISYSMGFFGMGFAIMIFVSYIYGQLMRKNKEERTWTSQS